MEKNWGEINADVLRLIANKVGDIANFIRLRAVCKYWRSVVHPSDLPPQLPWFIRLDRDFTGNFVGNAFSIYSNQTHCWSCSMSKATWDLTSISSSGYLYGGVNFFNPLTGVEVPLPIPSGFCSWGRYVTSTSNTSLDKQGMDVMFAEYHRYSTRRLKKIGTSYSLLLWRYYNKKWTKIFELPSDNKVILHSYYNGKLYVVNYKETTKTNVVDVATSKIVSVIQNPPSVRFHYLIDACGDLLGIQYLPNGHPEFQIYRLDDATNNPRWTQLNRGIGDRILFLKKSMVHSRNGGFCLNANDFGGIRGNCIYIYFIFFENYCCGKYNLIRYDLSECKSEILETGDLAKNGSWFVPSLC